MTGPSRTSGDAEVVVAVDGSPASVKALEYATVCARQEDAALRLVHVVPQIGPLPPLSMLIGDMVLQTGHQLLDDLTARARVGAPDLEIRQSLRVGPRNFELVSAASDAALLVLGRSERRSLLGRSTGSTAAAIAAASDCPLRVVPPDWNGRAAGSDVVVGVHDVTTAGPVVRRGLELAERSGGVLVLVQAWYLPSGYEEIMTPAQVAERSAHAAVRLEHAFGALRADHPRVPVQARVVNGRPQVALAEAAGSAGLLVVGRPAEKHVLRHIGRTARSLLLTSPVPVEVGPRVSAEAPPEGDLSLEAEGALLR